MRIGYLRSEGNQAAIDTAIAALEEAGTDRVFFDSSKITADETSAVFEASVGRMDPGDTLVVTHLGQLARTTDHLLERLAELIDRGITVETLSGELDISDPAASRCIMALHSFHLRMHRPRQAPRRLGSSGRPRRLSDEDIASARAMIEEQRLPAAQVARTFDVSPATLYRAFKRRPSAPLEPG